MKFILPTFNGYPIQRLFDNGWTVSCYWRVCRYLIFVKYEKRLRQEYFAETSPKPFADRASHPSKFYMKKLVFTTVFAALFIFASEVSGQCADLDDCNAKLSQASQMINKLLDVKAADESVIRAKQAEVDALRRLVEVKDAISNEKDKLLDYYRKQTCSTTSFLFGLVKLKSCKL